MLASNLFLPRGWHLINDLLPSDAQTWKYVDDTTLAEVIPKDGVSHIQSAVDPVVHWLRNLT